MDPALEWIAMQQQRMVSLVTLWSEINSGSRNLPGLGRTSRELQSEFASLGGEMREIELPAERVIDSGGQLVSRGLGRAISIRKRPQAPVQIFLGIHMDTVYGVDHPFQHVKWVDDRTMNGPGVADAKGGLCVMLLALEAFERCSFAENLGWELLINSDEELGSPGSAGLLAEAAGRNHVGMVFEPAMSDGAMVGERKGSGNFSVVIQGKAAHAGRDFHEGRSAMFAAAELMVALESLNRKFPGTTVNVGQIDGGGPSNIVPDLAVVRFNVRVPGRDDQERIEAELRRAVDAVGQRDGIKVEMYGGFNAPPRPMDERTTAVYQQVAECGREIGLHISWRASGGVSDANKLSAAGLPVIDTLGPCGGNLHSGDEFLLTDTLVPKAQLSALFLMKLARGEITISKNVVAGQPIK